MLRLQQVHIALKNDGRDLVKEFSLTIGPGDKAAVIGEEGNGKSTLLRWIADPDSVENYAECEGLCHCTGTIGLLSQENGVPGDRRVSDYLQGVELYGGLPVPCGRCTEIWSFGRAHAPFLSCPGAKRSRCAWCVCWPGIRTCCFLTNRRTIWTWRHCAGWKSLSGQCLSRFCLSLMMKRCWKEPQTSSSISNRSRKTRMPLHGRENRLPRVCRGPFGPSGQTGAGRQPAAGRL